MAIRFPATRKPHHPRGGYLTGPPGTSAEEEEDGLELPVNPDESNPIIPDDDDRVVHVPA